MRNKPAIRNLMPIPAFVALLGALAAMPNLAEASPAVPSENARSGAGSSSTTTPAEPDNSKVNKGDESPNSLTADHAGEQASDRDIMQKIRKAVVADKSLSSYAQNIKIISQNGKVTLKGPVKSDTEKQNIEVKATEVVGTGNVVNDLSITNSN